jgi:hypothetical protein
LYGTKVLRNDYGMKYLELVDKADLDNKKVFLHLELAFVSPLISRLFGKFLVAS